LVVFASLLQSPEDTAIYRTAVTGQLALVAPGGRFRTVGKPAPYRGIEVSPTGDFFLATYLDGPVSYILPESSFGERDAIIDVNGKELAELEKRPIQTEDEAPKPKDDARRAIRWRPDGAGLSFLQLGPADKDKKRKDRLLLWKAPFTDKDVTTVYEQDNRISSVNYTSDAKQFTVTDSQDGKTRIRLFALGKPESRTIAEFKADEADITGTLINAPYGTLRINADRYVYFGGTNKRQDVLKDPVRPWIEQVDLTDGKRTRLFEGAADAYESATMTTMTTNDAIVVSRQSRTEVPDLYAQNLTTKTRLRLTENVNYVPDLTRAKIDYIPVTRADGMKFWVKVTSPAEGVFRRKAFFWFYPSEFKDQKAYDDGRKNLNPNLFTPVSGGSKTILLRAGYVLVEPDCPIFSNYGASNDSYVPQLRNNLSAAIDELAKRDIIDREKLAIGGHSYGAFSTMNALIHTPFFKAGIAGDGNYNRTLTPYGFQNESRPLWLGREVYLSMSPILYADQINAAVLMYHGGDDQNVGTALINSERMFNALESLGKTAALYVYPYEDHGQIAKETMLDQWARWVAWLDKYVK
jgi:dienelactone hydrolase